MKITHPPHITKLKGASLPRDADALHRSFARPMVRIRIDQHGDSFTLRWPWPNIAVPQDAVKFQTWLEASGVDTAAAGGFDATVWVPPIFFRAGTRVPIDLTGLWPGGGTIFLCMNGPGFDDAARSVLANRPGVVTFAVNNGAHGFRPDFWACVDAPHRFMRSIWEDGRITKFVPVEAMQSSISVTDAGVASAEQVRDFPRVYGYRRNESFDASRWLTEDSINWGNHKSRGGRRSVMLAAMRIAILLGFRRICLVGCDFTMSESQKYWFDEDRTEQAIRNNNTSYEIMRSYFEMLRPMLDSAGIEVVNCNPGSRLHVFPFANLESEADAAAVDVSGSTRGMYRKRQDLPDK